MSDGALVRVFEIFHRYELASGAKLNVTKSHGLLVGSWISHVHLPVALQWSSESITVMGAKLSTGASVLSWQRPLEQLDQVFSSWKGQQLSFHGRALLANSLGLSLLWYLASFIAMPDMVVWRVNSLLFSFLWQEKRELVARFSLTQPSCLGSLGVVDVQSKVSALHVMWVRRFLEARGHPSAFFFQLYLRVAFAGCPVDQVLLLPAPSNTALRLLPPFYRSIMVAWFRLSCRLPRASLSSVKLLCKLFCVPW